MSTRNNFLLGTLGGLCALFTTAASGKDIVTVTRIAMDTAVEIAQTAVQTCRKQGYQVAAVVVDRGANVQVVMRDTLAPRFTVQIAEEKANAVILSGTDSGHGYARGPVAAGARAGRLPQRHFR